MKCLSKPIQRETEPAKGVAMVVAGALVEAMKLQESICGALAEPDLVAGGGHSGPRSPAPCCAGGRAFEANGARRPDYRRRQPSRRHAPALDVKRLSFSCTGDLPRLQLRHFHTHRPAEHGVTLLLTSFVNPLPCRRRVSFPRGGAGRHAGAASRGLYGDCSRSTAVPLWLVGVPTSARR